MLIGNLFTESLKRGLIGACETVVLLITVSQFLLSFDQEAKESAELEAIGAFGALIGS